MMMMMNFNYKKTHFSDIACFYDICNVEYLPMNKKEAAYREDSWQDDHLYMKG